MATVRTSRRTYLHMKDSRCCVLSQINRNRVDRKQWLVKSNVLLSQLVAQLRRDYCDVPKKLVVWSSSFISHGTWLDSRIRFEQNEVRYVGTCDVGMSINVGTLLYFVFNF